MQQVVCVQSGAHHLDVAKAHAAVRRVCPKIKRCHVGLFFYWIEDQERLRMHPFRYKLTVNVQPFYASAWEALEWAPDVLKYVPAVPLLAEKILRAQFVLIDICSHNNNNHHFICLHFIHG